jgi:hypothetical protein
VAFWLQAHLPHSPFSNSSGGLQAGECTALLLGTLVSQLPSSLLRLKSHT